MSKGEDALEFQLKAVGIAFEREHRFHPVRKWRFDFAFPAHKLACEIHGGVWNQGRHTRGAGFIKDMEKSNEAARLGWRVIAFTPQQVNSGMALKTIEALLMS